MNIWNNTINNKIVIYPINFKKGLHSSDVKFVESMKSKDYLAILNNIKNKYNIDVNVGESNVVAYCLDKTLKIMSTAGFKLPQKFDFTPLPFGTLGSYNTKEDCVKINSNNNAFYDLILQNNLEESQGSYHPITGHFLHTYLHEFSHAAHYKNLCSKYNKEEANNLFWGDLSIYSPTNLIVEPIKQIINENSDKIFETAITLQTLAPFTLFSSKIFQKTAQFIEDVNNGLFKPANGLYSKFDLTEYFAEKNARLLAEKLLSGQIITNFAKKYDNINGGDFSELFNNIKYNINWGTINYPLTKIIELCQDTIHKIDSKIFQGNITSLKKSIYIKRN